MSFDPGSELDPSQIQDRRGGVSGRTVALGGGGLGIGSGTTLAGHSARAARLADLLAVKPVQLVEHIYRGAASAAAKRQDKSQNEPGDA